MTRPLVSDATGWKTGSIAFSSRILAISERCGASPLSLT
jgi:hypothetical protein